MRMYAAFYVKYAILPAYRLNQLVHYLSVLLLMQDDKVALCN